MKFDGFYNRLKSKQALASASQVAGAAAAYEGWAQALSAPELKAAFRDLASAPDTQRTPKGFALVRESARRTLGMAHFDVQLTGAAVLLEGRLAEMQTGEGKTLTITAAASLLALQGQGVHVVTANAYLARRDAELMRPVYESLGLTVSHVWSEQSLADKQAAYQCDIIYGVGSEFGFDYLKDHMVRSGGEKVQRNLFAAIVDEIDSVLIDEARVPLIISGPAADRGDMVRMLDACAKTLRPGIDYLVSLKDRTADLTDVGYSSVEAQLVASNFIQSGAQLYAPSNLGLVRQLHSAVKAYALFKRDRDYVVDNGELVLVDLGTGRKMPGRRFDDGLHEALEAKEGLAVRQATVTKATVTYQNYFTKYTHLSGLTGTAMTDAAEFLDLYNLSAVMISTNRPMARKVLGDRVYETKAQKFAAAMDDVKKLHATGQPVLIGCASIRDADVLDKLFTAAGIPHETLTARQIEREAQVIANAGRLNSVTIATNMAGRGTDILIGGARPEQADFVLNTEYLTAVQDWEQERKAVTSLGGLFVLGTERHGLRRVDNQLAGRSGRQGDPGCVQFLLSLEDDLLKVFGQNKQLAMLRRALGQGAVLNGDLISRLVTAAQRNFEEQGFSARKSLMKFDAALADQRQAVFDLRDLLLQEGTLGYAHKCVVQGVQQWLDLNMPEDDLPEQWNLATLKKDLKVSYGLDISLIGWVNKEELTAKEIRAKLVTVANQAFDRRSLKEDQVRKVVFDVIDEHWEDHLSALAELRENVSLKGFTGLNATFQFHNDAFKLFESFDKELCHALACLLLKDEALQARTESVTKKDLVRSGSGAVAVALEQRWVARNDLCPCNSGLKFKACHGKL